MLKVKNPQDLGAGLLFLAIGLAGLWFGRDLQFGSPRSMGPGFFPMIVSGLVILLGLAVALRSLAVEGPAIAPPRLRPLLVILAALAVFGFLIGRIGVLPGAMLMMLVAAYARPRVNLIETLVFSACMAAFVALVFVYGLNQPMPLWWNS